VWGLKGRYDEDKNPNKADKDNLNEAARTLYIEEVKGLIERFNKMLPKEVEPFYVPDVKFHRAIGTYAGKPYSATGELLSPEAYEQHIAEVLPGPGDQEVLKEIFKTNDWIVERDPSSMN